jgi:hypothetical protein
MISLLLIAWQTPPAGVVFPRDSSVIHAKLDLGAKGDGVADDTDALQRGLDQSSGMDGKTKVLYVPNGTYRLTKTLVAKNAIGPWLYGQSRDGVIFKLDDGVTGMNSVIRTHPNESGPTSADWFMRTLKNFTVNSGNNPATDGIRYYATNTGILQNVRVVGNGPVGINAGFLDQSGPNLVQDATVEGFETGIQSQWIWGQTLSRITVKDCRKVGVYVSANAVAIENLRVENTPLGLFVDYPNDWTWWGGVVALVNGTFTGGSATGPAIRNRNVLYARNIAAAGFKSAVVNEGKIRSPSGNAVREFASQDPKELFESPTSGMALPIKPEPKIAWETDPAKWVCANDYGAIPGDNKDDSVAFQAAINAAAAAKKTVVYFRGTGGGDPNWYNVGQEVLVKGTVRHIIGLGFGRILGDGPGRFVVSDASATAVKFENIDAFGGTGVILENRSASRSMLVESCGVRMLGTGRGDIFATNCSSLAELRSPGQSMWARQFNPEGSTDDALVKNNGGNLWILGLKSEGQGTRIRTQNAGRTEVFGTFMYSGGFPDGDTRPMFDVQNAAMSVMGLREISFSSTYPLKVREKRGTETRTLSSAVEQGWIGWALFNARSARAKFGK